MIPLAIINDGEKVEIVDFASRGKTLFYHIRDMGLVTGKVVEVIRNQSHGPVLIRIDELRLAIGRGMAMKILVRRLE